jgi:hypothetical protein
LLTVSRQINPSAEWDSKAETVKASSAVDAALSWAYSRNDRWKRVDAGWTVVSESDGDRVWIVERAEWIALTR